MRIAVRFSRERLVAGNYGIDREASAQGYAAALHDAIARDHLGAEISVDADEASSLSIVVTGCDEDVARGIVRSVEDLAWVVRQCVPWSVPG